MFELRWLKIPSDEVHIALKHSLLMVSFINEFYKLQYRHQMPIAVHPKAMWSDL